ncbi:hypothetical protein V1264_010933 [Littorina saxatilis]|uniref:Uncharacterized protein n=1 Tax=Littorina saxatilis TaxID=31220 RepID=A0AAN9GKG6_9CAEN
MFLAHVRDQTLPRSRVIRRHNAHESSDVTTLTSHQTSPRSRVIRRHHAHESSDVTTLTSHQTSPRSRVIRRHQLTSRFIHRSHQHECWSTHRETQISHNTYCP